MARPGGKEVGRVNIRAVPDSSKFRRDLRTMLERVERTVTVSLATQADIRPAQSTLSRFKKDWEGKSVDLSAGVATAAARAQLQVLTRPRFVPIIVRVQRAAMVRAAAMLAAFSGARVAGDLVKNLAERLERLDRALPKAAFVSTAIANLTSVVMNALGGILSTGQGFAQLLGLLGAAPGIFAGMAVGGLALGLALVDIKKQLAVLGPSFLRLQDAVSAKFWAEAREPIIAFVRETLPEFRAGLERTSTAIGRWSATVVQQISDAFGGGRITTMFDSLVRSIEIGATGLGGFAQALAVLGQVGGSYLPRLAQWLADLSNRFGAFLLQAEADGSLQRWIETGITAAKQLGSIFYSLGSIFSGLTEAMGGGEGFGPLADGLARVAEIVNSAGFQSTLSTIFAGAEAGASGLADALMPIGAMLSALAPTIQTILASSGQVLGHFLGQVATALSSPVFAEGLKDFFDGILVGIAALGPSLPAIADGFAAILRFAGDLGRVLGPVLGTTLSKLAPILESLLDTLGRDALPRLGAALVDAFEKIGPSLLELVNTISSSGLIPGLVDLVVAILPGLATAIQLVAGAIGFLLTPTGLPSLGSVLGPIIAAVNEWLLALARGKLPIQEFGNVIVAVFGGIGQVVGGAVEYVRLAANRLLSLIQGAVNGTIDLLNALSRNMQPFLTGLAVSTGGAINIQLGQIPKVTLPRLETGGDVLGSRYGTALVAGENYQAETIVNRGKMNDMLLNQSNLIGAVLRRLAEAPVTGHTWNIHEVVSPAGTAQAVLRRLNRASA